MVIYTIFAILVSSEIFSIVNLTSFIPSDIFLLFNISFQFEELPLVFPIGTSVVMINYLSFHLGMSIYHFRRTALLGTVFWFAVFYFFLQHYKYLFPFQLLHDFC